MSNNLRKFICSYFPSVVPNKFHDYITLLKSQRIYTNDLAIIVRKKTVLNNNIQGCVVVPNRATIKTYVSRCRRMNPRIRPSKCTRRYEWWNMWSLEYTVAQATYVRPGDNNDITVAVTFTLCIRRAGIRLILVQCEHNFKWRMYHSTAAAAALYALAITCAAHYCVHRCISLNTPDSTNANKKNSKEKKWSNPFISPSCT